MMNARIERFDSSLSPMAPLPLQNNFFGTQMAYSGSFLIHTVQDIENTELHVETLMASNEPDTVSIVTFSRPPGRAVQFESCGLALSGIPPLFSPRTYWASGPGGVVVVVGREEYEVDVYRGPDFSLERRIRREVPIIRATQAMAEAQVGEGNRMTLKSPRWWSTGSSVEGPAPRHLF
jgi:hypothetical protein